jgi:hypothetical protein
MSMIAIRTEFANRVVLPDGREVNVARARALGFTIESFDSHNTRVRADRKAQAAATARGDAEDSRPATPLTKGQALIAYAQQIEALPEAKSRPAAASEIWAKQTVQSMPVERAAAFLRGLPVETAPVAKAATTSTLTAQDNARFKRLLEIRINGLNVKADRGNNPAARNEAKKLAWSLRTYEANGCSFAEAFSSNGLDARATISSILNMGH